MMNTFNAHGLRQSLMSMALAGQMTLGGPTALRPGPAPGQAEAERRESWHRDLLEKARTVDPFHPPPDYGEDLIRMDALNDPRIPLGVIEAACSEWRQEVDYLVSLREPGCSPEEHIRFMVGGLHARRFKHYAANYGRLIDFYGSDWESRRKPLGNCRAQTMLVLSAIAAAGYFDAVECRIQLFSDHIQPVLKIGSEWINLVSGGKADMYAPRLPPSYFYKDFHLRNSGDKPSVHHKHFSGALIRRWNDLCGHTRTNPPLAFPAHSLPPHKSLAPWRARLPAPKDQPSDTADTISLFLLRILALEVFFAAAWISRDDPSSLPDEFRMCDYGSLFSAPRLIDPGQQNYLESLPPAERVGYLLRLVSKKDRENLENPEFQGLYALLSDPYGRIPTQEEMTKHLQNMELSESIAYHYLNCIILLGNAELDRRHFWRWHQPKLLFEEYANRPERLAVVLNQMDPRDRANYVNKILTGFESTERLEQLFREGRLRIDPNPEKSTPIDPSWREDAFHFSDGALETTETVTYLSLSAEETQKSGQREVETPPKPNAKTSQAPVKNGFVTVQPETALILLMMTGNGDLIENFWESQPGIDAMIKNVYGADRYAIEVQEAARRIMWTKNKNLEYEEVRDFLGDPESCPYFGKAVKKSLRIANSFSPVHSEE